MVLIVFLSGSFAGV